MSKLTVVKEVDRDRSSATVHRLKDKANVKEREREIKEFIPNRKEYKQNNDKTETLGD